MTVSLDKRRARLYKNLAVGAVLLIVSLALLVWLDLAYIMPIKKLTVPNLDNDLGVFWTGARTVWQGGNPYDFTPGSLFHQIAAQAGGDSDVFLSPFYLSLVFMPLAALSLPLAAIVWLVLIQILLGLSVVMLIQLTGVRITPGRFLACLGMALGWRYGFEVMILNNLSLVMLAAVVGSYYCSRRGRPLLAGVLAALLLLKPQLIFLTLPLLLVVPSETVNAAGQNVASWLNPFTYRRWLGFGLVCVVYVVYSFAVYPGWVSGWLGSAGGRYTARFDTEMTSVRSIVAEVVSTNLVSPLFLWLAALGSLAWLGLLWWSNRHNLAASPLLLSATISINLFLAPYVRSYDFCLLLVPLLLNWLYLRRWENAQLKAGRSFKGRWSWLWWALIILPWPLHIVAINTGLFALENLVNLTLLAITTIIWRSRLWETSSSNDRQTSAAG